MAFVVYLLCSVMSTFCAFMLMRAYLSNRTRLLFWSSACFVGIAINNILLSVDFQLGPSYDLSTIRAVIIFVAMASFIYGLIWDTV
ncbi:hypothetical protein AZI85_00215 [Bdellovibrio bacteriovorus]|uniref:Uncharacterized protein n=1 Tax=Bdellovibrio bacteriovorus TaxID=959 RepID=A0A150WVK1_BDEBC|nr:DUF5985 family protein [Bdellovibrio bacteriovorus]KYG70416.1 hypothetical protein AZI85_00215 [Bdellovibrio bacteriovorus]